MCQTSSLRKTSGVFQYMLLDLFQNRINILYHFFILEPQNRNPQIFKITLFFMILFNDFFEVVGISVYFYHQLHLGTIKICYIITDRLLAMEITTHHLFTFKMQPKTDLGPGAVVAKLAGSLF